MGKVASFIYTQRGVVFGYGIKENPLKSNESNHVNHGNHSNHSIASVFVMILSI